MDERKEKQMIQQAFETSLSGLQDDPWLARRVMAQARETEREPVKVKRKLSVGLIVMIALMLVTVTAVAVALLTASQLVEDDVVPIARGNDTAEINEWFSNEELRHIIEVAQENNIQVSDELLTLLENGRGYYEQEVIMSLLRAEFGDNFSEWTIEQQHWFGEIMVEIGFRDYNQYRLPDKNEISYQEAVGIAKEYIAERYGDDVTDVNMWKLMVSYEALRTDEGIIRPVQWCMEFTPFSTSYNAYSLTMSSAGEVLTFYATAAPGSNESGDAVIDHYISVYGGLREWTYDIWASLGERLKGCAHDIDTERSWAFYQADYILPPEKGIPYEEAQKIAIEAVGNEYTTTRSAVCCQGGGRPIWKIETLTQYPEDIGSGRYSAIWLVEIDCMTGEVLDKQEFVVGGGTDPLITFVPHQLWINMPLMPEGPNG